MWRFLIHSFSSLYRCAAFLSILLLVTGPQAYAQSADGDDFEIEAWALQFRITEYFTLSSFQGGSLAVKKQRSDRSAFRFGVGLTASSAVIRTILKQRKRTGIGTASTSS